MRASGTVTYNPCDKIFLGTNLSPFNIEYLLTPSLIQYLYLPDVRTESITGATKH